MADKPLVSPITAEYMILRADLPGQPHTNVGVVLVDQDTGRVYKKVRTDLEDEVLHHLDAAFDEMIAEMGEDGFIRHLKDSFSNTLLVGPREEVRAANPQEALSRVYSEHVDPVKVIPFRTHLPLYSLRAAATKFGEDMEVEQQAWVPVPGRRLSETMFVARVVGHSMEPTIPDGSLCVFRAGVVGSRQGKRLLVQVMGSSESGGEFTVKKYSSVKTRTGEDEWAHEKIRFEPLNPEFEAMEFTADDEHRRFRVIAEFIEVLESE